MNNSHSSHANLYRFDGRFYDLNEDDGVLTLRLRRSLLWERSFIAGLTGLLVVALAMALNWIFRTRWPLMFASWEGIYSSELGWRFPLDWRAVYSWD